MKHPPYEELEVDDPQVLFDMVVESVVALGWVGMTGGSSERQS